MGLRTRRSTSSTFVPFKNIFQECLGDLSVRRLPLAQVVISPTSYPLLRGESVSPSPAHARSISLSLSDKSMKYF